MVELSGYSIVLASSSPRRIELLQLAGLSPKVIKPDIDETQKKGESPQKMVGRLALEKAEAVLPSLLTGDLVIIAADTTVVAPDKKTVLGKPENEADALRMLKKIAGKTHTVHTGYCVLSRKDSRVRKKVRVVTTRVSMRKMSEKEIQAYLATGESMDKAGSYAAQGNGMVLIEKISGSYTNVIGLPVTEVLSDIKTLIGKARS